VGDEADWPLWAVFLEATNGERRVQWMLFPMSMAAWGSGSAERRTVWMKRTLLRPDHRAVWKQEARPGPTRAVQSLKDDLDTHLGLGWTMRQPIAIRLEEDDYLVVYNQAKTPHKALRHVNKVAQSRGYRVV
jgi:hypothetical protein